MEKRAIAVALALLVMFGPAVRTDAGGFSTKDYGNDSVTVSADEADQGAVIVKWHGTGDEDIRVRVRLEGEGGEEYTYRMDDLSGTRITFTQGPGKYRVRVLQHVSGTRFRVVYETVLEADPGDGAFLGPNAMVRYGPDSGFVAMAADLCEGDGSRTDDIGAVYNYVRRTVKYDQEKAGLISSGAWTGGSVPDLEAVYDDGKGVCYDIAGLMTAMLRSRGVPCMLVYGDMDDIYHAWCMVLPDEDGTAGTMDLTGGEWCILDPTVGSCTANERLVREYIRTGAYTPAMYY